MLRTNVSDDSMRFISASPFAYLRCGTAWPKQISHKREGGEDEGLLGELGNGMGKPWTANPGQR